MPYDAAADAATLLLLRRYLRLLIRDADYLRYITLPCCC